MIAAVQYAIEMRRNTIIWTDSAFAAEGMVRLLHDEADLPEGHCGEDWMELQGLLCHCDVQVQVHHVPGHAKWVNQGVDFDNWAARWNDRADREANMAMKLHGEDLLCLHRQLCAHHERELSEVCALQELHLDIMEKPEQNLEEDDLPARGEEGGYDLWVGRGCPASPSPFVYLPLDDDARCATLVETFGQVFVLNFLQVIRKWEADESSGICKISFLELAVFVATEGKKWIPMPHLHRAGCWQDRDAFNFSEPNLGALVRLIKAFFHSLGQCFSLDICWCKGINLSFLGVCTPQDGLTLAISLDDANLSMDHLKCFASRRPIRRANDLARPLRA